MYSIILYLLNIMQDQSKQIVERLIRTFNKQTYRISCGYHNFKGASNKVALWVAFTIFLGRMPLDVTRF